MTVRPVHAGPCWDGCTRSEHRPGPVRPPADRRRYEVQSEVTVEWGTMRAQLRKRRVDLGLRQVDVAELMGRSNDFVAVLENNKSFPNVATLLVWINALGGELAVDFPSP